MVSCKNPEQSLGGLPLGGPSSGGVGDSSSSGSAGGAAGEALRAWPLDGGQAGALDGGLPPSWL